MNYVTPIGFRDIMGAEAQVREDLTSKVRALLDAQGYRPIETPTLEVLDVMKAGGHVPNSPFKFFDSYGDLLAMRPDVTMQVARMCATRVSSFDEPLRLRYAQRVFRADTAEAEKREVSQLGIECIGAKGVQADIEVLSLFAQCLEACNLTNYTIALGSARVLRDLLSKSGGSEEWQREVMQAYHESNFVDLAKLVAEGDAMPAVANAIGALPRLRGGKDSLAQVRELLVPLGCTEGLDELEAIIDALEANKSFSGQVNVDFSVMSSFDYYTGIVFEAYAPGLGSPLGAGGRYDNLLASYGAGTVPSAGFAFYLEEVMEAYSVEQHHATHPLRIAVPKGSLNKDAIACLEACGLDVSGLIDSGRTLMMTCGDVEYIIVRPTDAPVFVATGAADCGICGEDSLLEANHDVVELVDLKFGGCRFVVAEQAGSTERVERRYNELGSIRIATKYPNITRAHFGKVGMQVEIVQLHGNIELGPITGMAERIVDITATGTTLRENNLVVVEDVLASTARFFANPCAFRTNPRVGELADTLSANIKED